MKRGKLSGLALAFACLVLSACAPLQKVTGIPTTAPHPASRLPLAVSALADSIYLVDPGSGAVRTVASGLTDFQSGYASWSPDHRHLAYGNAGLLILDTDTGSRRRLIAGQSLSMPAWSRSGKQIAFGDGLSLWVTPTGRITP